MSKNEEVLGQWLGETLNDFYLLENKTFEHGVKIVEHVPEAESRQFYQLLCNLFPWITEHECQYIVTDKRIIFVVDSDTLSIYPYDDEIHHTLYVKEAEPNG